MRQSETIHARITPLIEELVGAAVPLQQAKQVFEDKYEAAALKFCGGNVTRAALRLGVHRNTLHNHLRYRRPQ